MQHFFFDIRSSERLHHDFRGRFLVNDDARQMAELIALDLECSDTDDWTGAAVEVRDVRGGILCSVPVLQERIAA